MPTASYPTTEYFVVRWDRRIGLIRAQHTARATREVLADLLQGILSDQASDLQSVRASTGEIDPRRITSEPGHVADILAAQTTA